MSVSDQMQVADRFATEARLAGTAVVALAIGAGVYLLDRDWVSTLFLGGFAGWQPARHAVFGALGATLPSFLHAYAFTVLLILALWPWPQARGWAASGWFAIAAGLEILQAPGVALAAFGPPDSTSMTLVRSLALYAWRGEFDPADLWATALGCATAWAITNAFARRLS